MKILTAVNSGDCDRLVARNIINYNEILKVVFQSASLSAKGIMHKRNKIIETKSNNVCMNCHQRKS